MIQIILNNFSIVKGDSNVFCGWILFLFLQLLRDNNC